VRVNDITTTSTPVANCHIEFRALQLLRRASHVLAHLQRDTGKDLLGGLIRALAVQARQQLDVVLGIERHMALRDHAGRHHGDVVARLDRDAFVALDDRLGHRDLVVSRLLVGGMIARADAEAAMAARPGQADALLLPGIGRAAGIQASFAGS
jgi:hypothetical protein